MADDIVASDKNAVDKRYLAFDIGCIECGEPSAVIGVFMTEDEANCAVEVAQRWQRENWTGQHCFEVYEIEVPSGPEEARRG